MKIKIIKEESFKPHPMFDPKTGKKAETKKEKDHLDLAKKGYVHVDPKKIEKALKDEGGAAGLKAIVDITGASEEEAKLALDAMPNVGQHEDGDYILADDSEVKIVSEKRKKRKKSSGKKDACYHKVKRRYKVWPSAYASGALVKCRKVGAKNWGNKSKKNEEIELDEKKKSWSKSERSKRAEKCANPKGFTMKQFCKNQNSKSKTGEKKNESFDVNERCQKGYKTHPTRKTKIMFGKKYRNCVKAEEGNDPKTGTGKKPKGSSRRLYTDENPNDTVSVKFSSVSDIRDTFSKASFKSKSHKRQSQIINLVHQRVRAAYKNAKDPKVKARLKKALDYAENRKEASKEKTKRMKK